MTDSDTDIPDQKPSPDPVPPAMDEAPASGREERRGDESRARRRTVFFVVGFLLIAGGTIAAYQFVTETIVNHLYLYTVAWNTAGVLEVFGDEVQFEMGERLAGHEREVRSQLDRWAAGELEELPPLGPPDSESPETPLTRWEVYRYRMLDLQRNLAIEQRYFDMLSWEGVEVESLEEHIAFLENRYALLDRAIYRENGPARVPVASPTVIEMMQRLRHTVDRLSKGTVPSRELYETINAVQTDLDWIITEGQYKFMLDRLVEYSAQVRDSGPYIHFIARPSYSMQIARLELASREAGEEGASSRAEIERLRAELDLKRQEAIDAGKPPFTDRGKAFPFIIVPECGAIPSMSIFVAAVIAFPCAFWRRLLGILLGVPVLYYVNVGRLVCLALIGAYDDSGQVFKFVHEYVWQGIFVIFVVIVWLVWVETLVKKRPTPSA
jgi:exosortase/archaeosortase family protein